jgi:hypothetical protein
MRGTLCISVCLTDAIELRDDGIVVMDIDNASAANCAFRNASRRHRAQHALSVTQKGNVRARVDGADPPAPTTFVWRLYSFRRPAESGSRSLRAARCATAL